MPEESSAVESRTFEPNLERRTHIRIRDSKLRKIRFRYDASDTRFEEIRRFDGTGGEGGKPWLQATDLNDLTMIQLHYFKNRTYGDMCF